MTFGFFTVQIEGQVRDGLIYIRCSLFFQQQLVLQLNVVGLLVAAQGLPNVILQLSLVEHEHIT